MNRRLVVGGVLGLVIVAAVTTLLLRTRAAPAPAIDLTLPDFDLAVVEPQVASRIRAAERSVQRTPGSAAAWGTLGTLYDAHGLIDPAASCYERARRLDPIDAHWPALLAQVRELRGTDGAEVVALYDAAIRLAPRLPALHVRRGETLMRAGRYEEAAEAYRAALGLDPGIALSHCSLGQALLLLDDLDGARAHLEQAAAIGPEDAGVQASLAQVYARLGDDGRAARASARSRQAGSGLAMADPIRHRVESLGVSSTHYEDRAMALVTEGRWAEALEPLRIVADLRPDHSSIQYYLGRALLETGDRRDGRRHLERAIALRDDLAVAHAALGALLFDAGDPERGVAHLRRAVELDPENPRFRSLLDAALGRRTR